MSRCPCCAGPVLVDGPPVPRIAVCTACGTGVSVPPPSRDVASDGLFEEGSYAGLRLERRAQWDREAQDRLQWVLAHRSAGDLLEVGAATGEFVAAAERAGFRCVGLETSGWAAEQAQHVTDRVVHADLATWRRVDPSRAFDAIVLFHTLEHVDSPAELLTQLRDVARPGAHLVIEVPNGGSRAARRDGPSWDMALMEDHVNHFTANGLRLLLASSGFEVFEARALSWRRYWAPRPWVRRRLKQLRRGAVAPSRDLLRVVAVAV